MGFVQMSSHVLQFWLQESALFFPWYILLCLPFPISLGNSHHHVQTRVYTNLQNEKDEMPQTLATNKKVKK